MWYSDYVILVEIRILVFLARVWGGEMDKWRDEQSKTYVCLIPQHATLESPNARTNHRKHIYGINWSIQIQCAFVICSPKWL